MRLPIHRLCDFCDAIGQAEDVPFGCFSGYLCLSARGLRSGVFLSLFSPGRYDGIYAFNIELWRMFDKVIPVIN
jgi:hypothetical protein